MSSYKLLKRTNDHLRPVLGFFMCRRTEISASGNASRSSMPELCALRRGVIVSLNWTGLPDQGRCCTVKHKFMGALAIYDEHHGQSCKVRYDSWPRERLSAL
jgi:hypothetical protein